jgi:drug/metabolite transporter (DMT)-like permease
MKISNAILFAIPALIWGSTWYAIKFQIGDTDPLFSVGYRFVLAGLILVAFSKIRKLNMQFSAGHHLLMALQGACLFGLNYWLVYMAEQHLTSGLVAVVFSGLVFANVFFSALVLRAPIRKQVIAGGLIGVVGVALIFRNELAAFSFSDENFVAFLMAVGSVTLASVGNIMSAFNQRKQIPVIQSNAFGMLYGASTVLAIALVSGKEMVVDLSATYVVSMAYLAVFGSVIAFTTYLNLLGKVGPDRAGYIALVMPVIALGISTVLEGYQWTMSGFLGLFMILIGIFMAVTKRKKPTIVA